MTAQVFQSPRRARSFLLTLLLWTLAGAALAAEPLVDPLPGAQSAALPDGISNNGAANWLAEQDEEPFLKVDEAFNFSTREADGALVAQWSMPPGYYLYRHAFDFELRDQDAGSLGTADIPAGKPKYDEYFGDVEVYYAEAQATIPVAGAQAGPLEVGITYQGCADAGLCYPPETKWVLVNAVGGATPGDAGAGPSVGASVAPAVVAVAPQTEEARLTALLTSGGLLQALATFFLAGMLLAFTPCVLPMVPILSSIIVGDAQSGTGGAAGEGGAEGTPSRGRAFRLSLAYVLGMALTYALVGVLMGLFGAELNLQAALQSPTVLSVFAVVFVLLSLSMFGLYELQMPQSWQNRINAISQRQQGGRYPSVFVMGSLSSLVVSPCISAPLIGALAYIASTGNAVYGGLALLALALGMGVPLLVIGAFGDQLLPRAGVWMNAVKAVFGVLLLGVAIWLLERVVPAGLTLALWAGLAIGVGVYLGALDFSPRAGWSQLWKAGGAVSFVYGVLLLIGAASGAVDPLRPLATIAATGAPAVGTTAEQHGGGWVTTTGLAEFEAAHATGVAAGKPVLLDLYADWCVSCKVMERRVFPQPEVASQLARFHLIRADVTANSDSDQALMDRFGLFGPPSMVFFDPGGTVRPAFTVQGELDADGLSRHLRAALDAGPISANMQANASQ
ncbi:MAG: protein-disulfide reductase DsbD [Pseudomonadota bacterium]